MALPGSSLGFELVHHMWDIVGHIGQLRHEAVDIHIFFADELLLLERGFASYLEQDNEDLDPTLEERVSE